MYSHLISIREAECLSSNVGGGVSSSQFTFKGCPHNPLFTWKEASENVWNWLPLGIAPTNWLKERSRTERKVRLTNSLGIFPLRWLRERSNDSSCLSCPIYDGIWPVKPLPDKLRTYSDVKFPISSGIWPSKLLKEKSMEVKRVRTFTSSISWPLLVTYSILIIQFTHF